MIKMLTPKKQRFQITSKKIFTHTLVYCFADTFSQRVRYFKTGLLLYAPSMMQGRDTDGYTAMRDFCALNPLN